MLVVVVVMHAKGGGVPGSRQCGEYDLTDNYSIGRGRTGGRVSSAGCETVSPSPARAGGLQHGMAVAGDAGTHRVGVHLPAGAWG